MLKVKLKRQFHDLTSQEGPSDVVVPAGVKRKKIDSTRLEDETKWLLLQELQVKQLEEIHRIRNEEHKRLVFALKNQRQRLHYEKMAELTRQKTMFERLLHKCKNQMDGESSPESEVLPLDTDAKNTSDVEVNEEKNVGCENLDQKTAGLKLVRTKYKNKMLSPCRSYSWRTKDLHLSAMTPIEEEEEDPNWLEEKRRLIQENKELKEKLWSLEQRQARLEVDLQEARDQNELLEFRILEVEQTQPNGESKIQDKCVNTDSCDGSLKGDKVQPPVDNNYAEKIRSLETECHALRLENKNLTLKLIGTNQLSSSTQESMTDSMFDNRSQGGETGYSSDEYDDMNASLSCAEVASPTPSIDSANVEFEEIVQKINGLNGENGNTLNSSNFPGSLEELNLRNKINRANGNNDFFWSLSEVAHKIKESEEMKTKLRANLRSLEEELKRVINERDALKQMSFKSGEKLSVGFYSQNIGEEETEKLNLESCSIETLRNLLTEKERELHNKEVEYSLKMDALKCDLDETVNRLENRLEVSQRAEIELREKFDTVEQEKRDLEEQMRQKDAEAEMDKMTLVNQLRSLQQAKEKLEERVVIQNNRMAGKQLFSVSEEIYGDDTEEKMEVKASTMPYGLCKGEESGDDTVDSCEEQNPMDKTSKKQLKQRLFELEKKERAYRETLHEADKIMADVERSYQERIEEQEAVEERLRARIVQLEQSEKRLRQALRNTKHNSEVSKFGELLDRLLETEASERRLKSKIHELEREDRNIRKSLTDVQRDKHVMEQELQDQEELLKLVSDLRQTEKEMKTRIAQLETSEGALKETLAQADAILMEREIALKEKVEQLEAELIAVRREKEEFEVIIRDQHPNRVQSMADVINSNAKLDLQLEELEEINNNLRGKILELETEIARFKSQNPLNTMDNNESLFKLNLEILERESHIERLLDKIKILEAGNIPMELQALSLHADELKQLKEKINSLSAFVQHCNCGNCANCQPLLIDIENQVKVLDEIIFGGNSVEMKEEKTTIGSCLNQGLISLKRNKSDGASNKEDGSVPEEKCDVIIDLEENNVDSLETMDVQFQNNNKIVKISKNKFTYCSIDEIEDLRNRVALMEREVSSKEKLFEVTEQQLKSLQIKLGSCEKELEDKIAELSKTNLEKANVLQENESLQHRVWKAELSERVLQEKYLKKSQSVVSANKQARDAEQKIGLLSRQLRHWETSNRDSINLKEKIQELETELQKRRESERKLYAENLHLHHKVESQRERINSMQLMKKDYQTLNNKVDLLEKKRLIAEQSIPSLKNKITQLTQRCKDKDQIIHRLDKQIQSKMMSPHKDSRLSLNRRSNHDENSLDKDEKAELRDEFILYNISPHSASSDNSDCSVSPRPAGSKSKIPRYTALPSPIPSPRNKHVQFEKTSSDDEKINLRPNKLQISPRPIRSCQRLSRTNRNEGINQHAVSDQLAPSNFRVTRKVAPDSLLVAWTVPNIGSNISGYLIFVNNELHQKVRSPNRTKALLNRLDFNQDIDIAIQSLLDTGASSSKVSLVYSADEIDKSNESPPLSARSLDERSFKNYKRQCVVCKDFTPINTEDNKPTLELKVKQGDIVTIFGGKSANNFYYAEADGNRGILPAHILENISVLKNCKGDSFDDVPHSD